MTRVPAPVAPRVPASAAPRPRPRRGLRDRFGLAAAAGLLAPLLVPVALGGAGQAAGTPDLGAAPAAAAVTPEPSAPVSADGLPTVQTDGIVYSVAVVGDVVYAGGNFDHARPAGQPRGGPGEVERRGLLAFRLSTGELLPWNPGARGDEFRTSGNPGGFCDNLGGDRWVCDSVFRLKASPDGTRLYAAGDFTQVGADRRYRVAAFDLAGSGSLVRDFRPAASSRVRGLAVTDDTVYLGGSFTSVDGQPRTRLAAVDLRGDLTGWAPTADSSVWALAPSASADRVLVGGQFARVNGGDRYGLDSVLADGTSAPFADRPVPPYGSFVTDIVVDGPTAYVASDGSGRPQFDGRLSLDVATGSVRWLDNCYGANQSVAVDGDVVYSASHSHNCDAMDTFPEGSPRYYQRLVAESTDATGTNRYGDPIPTWYHWQPEIDGGPSTSKYKNGPWAVDAADGWLVAGGEFLSVNREPQEGLVRFRTRAQAPRKQGPVFPFGAPVASSLEPGSVRVTWQPTYDRDDATLTYTVLRDEKPVHEVRLSSSFWEQSQPEAVWTDRSVTPGARHVYRLRVRDGDGNSIGSPAAPQVTVADGSARPALRSASLRTGASSYWTLDEPGGGTAGDLLGRRPLALRSGVTLGVPGSPGTGAGTAARFDGTSAGVASVESRDDDPQVFSVDGWFRTTTRKGGSLWGYGSQTAGGGDADRVLWMGDDGRLHATVDARTQFSVVDFVTVDTPGSYNDGDWHHVALVFGEDGMALSVDGTQVVSTELASLARHRDGYWRLGSAPLGSWARGVSSSHWAGELDEVALHRRELTADDVAERAAVARGATPPDAAAAVSCTDLACTADSAGSTPGTTGGGGAATIVAREWDMGDGTRLSGASPSHTYARAGTYAVRLTVTASTGLRDSETVPVTVTAPDPVLALDRFPTAATNGFGSAERGGAWAVLHDPSEYSVPGGKAYITHSRLGTTRAAWLPDVAVTDAEVGVAMSVDRLPAAGGSMWFGAVARRVGDVEYRQRVRLFSDGTVRVAVVRRGSDGIDRTLADAVVEGLVVAPGEPLRLRMEATGTSPTRLRASVQRASESGVRDWQVEATDDDPRLQVPGAVGVSTYSTAENGNVPNRVTIADFVVRRPHG